MSDIELGKKPNIEAEIDKKIARAIDSLCLSSEKIKVDYSEDTSGGVKLLFDKVGGLLGEHGEIESYKTRKEPKYYPERINHRTLNLSGDLWSIRIFEEKDRDEITIRIERKSGNYNSLQVRLREDDAMIHYGVEPSSFYLSELGLGRVGDLVDSIEKKKIEEEKKPEYQKSLRIRKFLRESEEIPHGDVLTSVFKSFASEWKLRGNNILIGKTEDKEDSPVIVLRNLLGAREIWLQVFRKEKKFNQSPGGGDIVVIVRGKIRDIGFDFKDIKPDMYLLSDKYNSLLIDVLAEVKSRFKKTRFGK